MPIGIQSFEKVIENQNIYVDKTEYVYNLVHINMPYFLSRPRRFGKSLLLSAMKAYWEGRKELFEGLKIEELEKDNHDAWQPYPVLYFDFNKDNYNGNDVLEEILEDHLTGWESRYDGYHFHQKGKGVYNPYSLLNALADREFDAYWYETGTPIFLVDRLKTICFDARKFTDGTLYARVGVSFDSKTRQLTEWKVMA